MSTAETVLNLNFIYSMFKPILWFLHNEIRLHFWEKSQHCLIHIKHQSVLCVHLSFNCLIFLLFFFLNETPYSLTQILVQVVIGELSLS